MVHLDALDAHADVDLRAIAECDAAAVRGLARRSGVPKVHGDWRTVLEDDDVDAVVVCVPTHLHADVGSAAFEAGKHVYLEKPLATDAVSAQRVARAWRTSGKVGVVGFNLRYSSVLRSLKARIAAGEVGRVASASVVLSSAARELPEWKRARATGGGAPLDLGSHAVDVARFLFERRIVDVRAVIESVRTEDDTAALTMRLDGGPTVQAQVTLAGVLEGRFEVLGDRGRLVADRHRGTLRVDPREPPYGRIGHLRDGFVAAGRRARTMARPPTPMASHRALLDAFVQAVRSGRGTAPDIEDGCRSLDVVLAAEEAHRAGRAVEVSTVEL